MSMLAGILVPGSPVDPALIAHRRKDRLDARQQVVVERLLDPRDVAPDVRRAGTSDYGAHARAGRDRELQGELGEVGSAFLACRGGLGTSREDSARRRVPRRGAPAPPAAHCQRGRGGGRRAGCHGGAPRLVSAPMASGDALIVAAPATANSFTQAPKRLSWSVYWQ